MLLENKARNSKTCVAGRGGDVERRRICPRGPDVCAESGNAIVEFIGVMVVLVAPALVLLAALATLASAHFALSQATSEAARVFTRSSSLDTAQVAARSQANEVWQDRGFSEVLDLSFSCQQSPCFVAGGGITLRLQTAVEIPLVGISVRIDDTQDVRIDQWRSL